MAWKTAILCYTDKKAGKTVARSYTGISASGSLSDACRYVARPEESLCFGHMHAEPEGELKRIQMNAGDSSYLSTVQSRWKDIVSRETGLSPKDWQGTGRAQSNAVSAYGYIIPLPNDSFDADSVQTRQRIETLLKSVYGTDSTDLTYALHRGNARYSEHEQNLHLHVLVRPRDIDGKKWQMNKSELLKWNLEKRRRLGDVLQSWGYKIEHTPTGQGQKRHTRGEHAVFLEKESAVGSDVVRNFGESLKAKNASSRTSRYHAGVALRWSAYQAAMQNKSWSDALQEQGWTLEQSDNERRTWQIKDVESGKTHALRRLFACKEAEVETYLMEMRGAIEQSRLALQRIREQRENTPRFKKPYYKPYYTMDRILGGLCHQTMRDDDALGGVAIMAAMCPAAFFLIAALLVAVKMSENLDRITDEVVLKKSLSASWQEEKELRQQVRSQLSAFVSQERVQPVQPTQPAPAPVPTSPTLPNTSPGSERPSAAVVQRQNGDIIREWDDYQTRQIARGWRQDGVLDCQATKYLLKKYEEPAIRTAFEAVSRPITSGMKRVFKDEADLAARIEEQLRLDRMNEQLSR